MVSPEVARSETGHSECHFGLPEFMWKLLLDMLLQSADDKEHG